MIHINNAELEDFPKIKRLNLINSITGIKPGNLIGTQSSEGHHNLAIFSSVVHLGSHPPLIGLISRPGDDYRRDTLCNILDTQYYTVNSVHSNIIERAHYTSARFDSDISEFETCRLTAEYLNGFAAPYVKESQLKFGLRLVDHLPIKANGTVLIIGEVIDIHIKEEAMDEQGHIDLSVLKSIGVSGLNTYYTLKKVAHMPYARVQTLPEFKP